MSDLISHIRSIDADPAEAVLAEIVVERPSALTPTPMPEDKDPTVFATLPWLWIAAFLIGWALLVAVAAWWVGIGPRTFWMWGLVWAVPGLVVSGLLTRIAVQAGEREAALLRLRRATSDIAQLEERLKLSAQSMFSATQTLSDATQLLLEQVDTSRDDLRNQIGSAQQLASALKDQTHALVTAQDGLRKTFLPGEDADDDAQAPGLGTSVEETAFVQPPLGLRPAPPEDEPVFETMPEPAVTTTPDWKWSDMLRSVDDRPAPVDSADVIELLTREGLSPAAIVTGGTVQDAAGVWQKQGIDAMTELLDIRISEPAQVLAAHMQESPENAAIIMDYASAYTTSLPTDADGRMDALMGEPGRAWLIAKAAIARLERSGA